MATPYQVSQAIQYALRNRKWEGNAGYTVVFISSGVRVTPIVLKEWLATKPMPLCIIQLGAVQHDPQVPALIDQQIDVILAQMVPGDEVGEWAVIGGNRKGATTTGQADSGGRGLTEIEEEFWAVAQLMTQDVGVQAQANATSDLKVEQLENGRFVASRQYGIRAKCSTARSYLGVTAFVATGASGSFSATWAKAPTQWDTAGLAAISGGQVLVYKSGATAPTTPTDGTAVPLLGTDTSKTVTPVSAGTYSVSIFTAYCESGVSPAVAERYSDPVSQTSITVT